MPGEHPHPDREVPLPDALPAVIAYPAVPPPAPAVARPLQPMAASPVAPPNASADLGAKLDQVLQRLERLEQRLRAIEKRNGGGEE